MLRMEFQGFKKMCARGIFLILFITLLVQGPVSSSKLPQISEVFILSGKPGSIPDNTSKLVEYSQDIQLYAALKGKQSYYLGYEGSFLPDKIRVEDRLFSVEEGSLKRWREDLWGKLKIKWYKIMPKPAPSRPRGGYRWYSNVFSQEEGEEGKWRGWQIIEYEQHLLPEEGWSFKPDKEVGTVRFRVEVIFEGKKISSPGQPDPHHPSGISGKDYDKGIKDTVHRISRLSNHPNKLVRYIEALRKVPWLWGADYRDPPENTPSHHQSDLFNPVGIDCADLVISALRAMGNEQLDYTSTEDLVRGRYTQSLSKLTLTYSRSALFKEWIPRGIARSSRKFFIYDREKIQIRDNRFNLIKEIRIKDPSLEIIDIAISEEGKIYSLLRKNLETKVAIINQEGEIQVLFTPEVKKSIRLGEEEYFSKIKINPTAIGIANQELLSKKKPAIYLLTWDTIYTFDPGGEELSSFTLKGAYTGWTPTGPLAVEGKLFYLPVDNRKILVYNSRGRIVKTIELEEPILDVEISSEGLIALHPFPLRVWLYSLDGSFVWDYSDRFLDEKGREVRIEIPQDLRVGDLLLTISPTYHTLLFYRDNGNHLLDSQDEVITAGHQGVEVRKVSYFEGRRFVLRRFKPEIKVE